MGQMEKLLSQVQGKINIRTVEVQKRTADDENRVVEFSVSSDVPYERWFGFEILDHSADAIRMDRLLNKAALRDTHYGDTIGVIEKAWIDKDENKLRVAARFSKNSDRADVVYRDVLDGIRPNVSVRYMIHGMRFEEKKGDTEYYRVTDWEPVHVSIENDPADYTVGIGRSLSNQELRKLGLEADDQSGKKTNKSQTKSGVHIMEETKKVISLDDHNSALENRDVEISNIRSMADTMQEQLPALNLKSLANQFIKEHKSDRDFWNMLEDKLTDPEAIKKPESFLDMPAKDVEDFSFIKALRLITPDVPQSLKKDCGLELEASDAVAKALGKDPNGIYIPFDIQKRDLTAGGTLSGAELVGTDHLGGSFIELLRNKMLARQLGAKVLGGLKGNVSIPKQTGASTFSWVATEAAGVDESTPATGSLSLTAKEGSAHVDISRQMILQGSPDAEDLVKNDLAQVVALGIDKAVFHGTGASGQPTGIAGTSGIGSVTIVDMDWDAALEFESKADIANALNNSMHFVSTPTVRAALKGRLKSAGVSGYICEKNSVNDYPFHTSNQVNAGFVFFGDFSQVIIGEWGNLDLQYYRARKTGIVTYTIFKTVDVGVRQAGAFVVGSSFS